MPVGVVSLSRISYHCDLQNGSGLIIPLGAIAEMTLWTMRVMGLIARTSLLDEEIENVGHLLRSELSDPFDFLEKEFDWAWANTEARCALQALAHRNDGSLFFSPPNVMEIEQTIKLPVRPEAADFASEDLRRRRDHEFAELLDDTWASHPVVPRRSVSELAP